MRTLTRVAIALTAGLATLFMVAPAASASMKADPSSVQNTTINLGGLDLDKYCKSLGHVKAVSVHNSASGWRCLGIDDSHHEISITDACNWQFLDLLIDGITVYDVNTGGLGGWRCASNPVRAVALGGMDLSRHCRALGYSHAVLVERNVSGWRCEANDGTRHEFSMHTACRTNNPSLVNNGWSLASTFESFGDAFGIRCAALRNF